MKPPTLEYIQSIAQPPEKRCFVYFLLKNNQIVYIGQSEGSIHSRVRLHTKDKDFDEFSFIVTTKKALSDLEAVCIVHFRPLYNVNLPINNFFTSASELSGSIGRTKSAIRKHLKKKNIFTVFGRKLGGYYRNSDIFAEGVL